MFIFLHIKMKVLIVCLLLAGASVYAEEDKSVSAVFNDYIDNAIPTIVDFLVESGFDPMEIPDVVASFSEKPIIITYHGTLELTQGILHNIKSLHRSGDVIIHYNNKQIHVVGSIGINDIAFDYNYLAKFMNIGPSGSLTGSLSSVSFYFDILIDFNDFEITLNNFYLYNVGNINIRLSGNVITDWFANLIIRLVTAIFKDSLLGVLEGKLREAIEGFLDNVNNNVDLSRVMLNKELQLLKYMHYGEAKKEFVKKALKTTMLHLHEPDAL